MIQTFTKLEVADNTGAKTAMCIGIPGSSFRRYAHIGDVITVVVKSAIGQGTIKNHTIQTAVVVRTKKECRRADGSYVRFDENACVLISKETREPLGTRVFGPIAREIRDKEFTKIASLASEVV
ncbi:MAG: 50S ribosomal protein L14 [bacterium]|nr:50S ribosomal protein L14 [bacterium]